MFRYSLMTYYFISLFPFYFCIVKYDFDIRGEAQNGYYISLGLGTPPQKANLLIDTGSSNLAIASAQTLKNQNQSYFRCNDSLTFRKLDAKVDLRYVGGHWSGFLGTDLIFLNQKRNITVEGTISCMTFIEDVFDVNSKHDGILGLAYSSAVHPNSTFLPFLDTLVKYKNVYDIFSLNLCGPVFSQGANAETLCGKLHLGFISMMYIKDEIIYTPVIRERLYEITLTDLRVGSKQIATECEMLNTPRAIIDTGTTNLLIADHLYKETVREIRANIKHPNIVWKNDTAGCFHKLPHKMSLFPVLILSFYHTHNTSFSLHIMPELYLLPFVDTEQNYSCFTFGIEASKYGTIVGSTVLKGYYLVFDRENKKVGFANSTAGQSVSQRYSFVTGSQYSYSSLEKCKYEKDILSSRIGAGTILLLLLAVAMSLFFLCMIVVWIQKHVFRNSDSQSDTSSLFPHKRKSICLYLFK